MEEQENILKSVDALKIALKEEDGWIVSVIKIMADTDDRLVNLVEFLQKIISVLIFAVTILIWKVFLWDYANYLLMMTISGWKELTEGYKILILGLIGSIPAGVAVSVISHWVTDKINFKKTTK
jgi:hypothetical protein